MIELRPYTKEDYEMACAWWAGHGVFPVPHEVLPPLSAVAVAIDEEGNKSDVAAAWVYLDNAVPMCFLAFPVVDPDARARDKMEGINHLVIWLEQHTKSIGYTVMAAAASIPSVAKLIERRGFVVNDTNITFLTKA